MAETVKSSRTRRVKGITSIAKTYSEYFIDYETGEKAKLNILNNHIFKLSMSPTRNFPEYPPPMEPDHTAKITAIKVTDYDIEVFKNSHIEEHDDYYAIHTHDIRIELDKIKATMAVFDKRTNKKVFSEARALSYNTEKHSQKLKQSKDEYFFGGGMQNGRFSHKGNVIRIVKNKVAWGDGMCTSPNPFYWSSYGYGVLRHTWQPGVYDFGLHSNHFIKTIHNSENFDAFYFVNPLPKDILADYFELTGKPIFMPEFAFYEAHLNCFNRDYWVKVPAHTPDARLFEDGKYYKCYQPNEIDHKEGNLESLNGENNNYQFSARAMIDRYKKHDIPLAWFFPNDGYGAGYGQTDSLDGDIENLKEFADYARKNGVEVALWAESQLAPKNPDNPKKGERDLAKEVTRAGVVALKCDVAWIGDGYSLGLNAVEHATKIIKKSTKDRPFIIMVCGWAGTQRYSSIWSGDQEGGEWEYIRFHIPTYIGSGLSGQPNVGSDMDGIFTGGSREVNIRDHQWKAFTPLQLNMDGWGNIAKTPFSFNEEATSINRAYLKLKSMFMPYNYSIAHESTYGLPMVRAMFLEFPEETSAYTLDSQYQYMWGPSILVAPIYKQKGSIDGSIRDGIYLPDPKQIWMDLFTGEKYQGGKIYNNMKFPIWKIPVFVKDGAIIPMVNPNNNPYEIERDNRIFNIYPNGESRFKVYEDDGKSRDYLKSILATTEIKVVGPKSNDSGDVLINIHATKGSYKNMITKRSTLLRIMTSKDVENIKAAVNGRNIKLSKVYSEKEFNKKENAYYFKNDYILNPFLNDVTGAACKQMFLIIKIAKIDVTTQVIDLKIKNYENKANIFGSNTKLNEILKGPCHLTALAIKTSITLQWQEVEDAIYYEVERDGVIFSNIIGASFTFENIKYETQYSFRIRSVNNGEVSVWSEIVYAIGTEDPYKHTVKGVKATCSIPCYSGNEVSNLTDGYFNSIFNTYDTHGKELEIKFDLRRVYELDKMEYMPRQDSESGFFLEIQHRHSIDGKKWSELSNIISWDPSESQTRTIVLNGEKMRYVEWHVLKSVDNVGCGRQVLFYPTSTVELGSVSEAKSLSSLSQLAVD